MAVTKLTGAEVYANMRKISELKEEISRYFHFDCKLWRAIWDHIGGSKDCVIVKREGKIPSHRGTGWGIRLQSWHSYGMQFDQDPVTYKTTPREPDVFSMTIVVEYYDEEENREWERTYYVNAPVELLTDFSTAKFESWIAGLRRERDALRSKKDLAKLRELIETYPTQAKEITDALLHGTSPV